MMYRQGLLRIVSACFIIFILSQGIVVLTSAAEKKQSGAASDKKDDGSLSSGIIGSLKFRNIGPGITGGRISSIAVDPRDHNTMFIGVASGGVWKSTNAGTTFTPVFDGEASYSIGCVTIDPANSSVIWVGTGENNSQRSVSYGDGVYKSEDGGNSWKNMGLKKSEHIARIVFDPRNTNVVYVASQGPLWGPGGDRGLFKSTDGGKSWKNILEISENTGVSDIVIDQKNPDILVASAYQRRRHVFTLIDGGPESSIHRSTDAGATWVKSTSGLPGGDLGRIGLAISPVDHNILYATVEAADRKGGIFRSSDNGVSWDKKNDFDATAMYYGAVFADPVNVDRIYVMNFNIMVSDDGGQTLKPMPSKWRHVDNHCIWVEPENPRHCFIGCDGGLYESFDKGDSWTFHNNLSITQFYDVAVDNAWPFYNVYGGTQDNFSWGAPSRSRSASGIVNSDWFVTYDGDGFQSRVDPEDPNTVYAEAQYGDMWRFDRRTGERISIQPKPGKGELQYHWNWDTPIMISPHSHTRLYVASNKLFRSDDRGDTWTLINGDLTRNIDRNKIPVMGKIWGADAVAKHASTSIYGNAITIAESPVKEGLLYVGTDDGAINISEDGGKTWRKETSVPGVPETTYVCRLVASQFDANTVYASFDNHKRSDFKPYILMSIDAGRTWKSIASNLPENGTVLAIAEDPVQQNLLFVGTEFGIFFTVDGGGKWIQLKGGLPTIAVRDIAIQKRENDIVIATFGRGFYVLDNYSPLRQLTKDVLAKDATILPIKDAQMYIESQPLGARGKSFQGDNFFSVDNPPFGATITYYLKDGLKSLKEKRKDAEKEAEKNKTVAAYPTVDQLRLEDEEEAPAILLTILDQNKSVIRNFTGSTGKGVSRVTWNLHETSVTPDGEDGPLVMPGLYYVTLGKRVNGVYTQLAGPEPIEVKTLDSTRVSAADRKSLADFQQKVARLQRAITGTVSAANDMRGRIAQIKKALNETQGATRPLLDSANAIDAQLRLALRSLRGDNTARQRSEDNPWSISERINSILDEERMTTGLPTQTHRDMYRLAGEEFNSAISTLRRIYEASLPALEKGLDLAGAPYTQGRLPDWKDQ